MSELPIGWVEIPIDEVVSKKVEQRTPLSGENFCYIDISSVDRNSKTIVSPQKLSGDKAPSRARQVVASDDVLVSMTRPNLNAVAMVPDDLDKQIASTGFDVLRPNGLDSRWLYYLVRTDDFVGVMSDLVQGALYPAVRPRDIRNYVIPLAPLNEQKRIADKLDTLLARMDSCERHLERVPQILKRFRQSVLAAATSGRLTEEWRETDDTVSKEFGDFEFPDFPANWNLLRIKEISQVKGGKRLPNGEKLVDYDTGFPYIRAGQLKRGTVIAEGQQYLLPSTQKKISRYIVDAGDVYITIVGAKIGDAGVIPQNYDKVNLTENAAKICQLAGVEGNYLALWLRSPHAQDIIQSLIKSGAQGKLALTRINEIPVPLPPIEEQAEIVRRVETLFAFADRLETRYATGHGLVEQFTPSLLAKAFRGELVEQDPNDESASALVERIRETREAQKAGPSGKSKKSKRS